MANKVLRLLSISCVTIAVDDSVAYEQIETFLSCSSCSMCLMKACRSKYL